MKDLTHKDIIEFGRRIQAQFGTVVIGFGQKEGVGVYHGGDIKQRRKIARFVIEACAGRTIDAKKLKPCLGE